MNRTLKYDSTNVISIQRLTKFSLEKIELEYSIPQGSEIKINLDLFITKSESFTRSVSSFYGTQDEKDV